MGTPESLSITSCNDHGGFSKSKVLKKVDVLPQNRGTFQQQNVDLFCGGTITAYNKASINTQKRKKWPGLYMFSKYLSKEFNILLLALFSINFQDFDNYLAAYFVLVDLIKWHKMSRGLQNDPNIPSKFVIISKIKLLVFQILWLVRLIHVNTVFLYGSHLGKYHKLRNNGWV